MNIGRLVRVMLTILVFVLCAPAARSAGRNVFHVRFDTVAAHAGDTVIVNVLYTLDSARPHNITGFTAHFAYDTNEIYVDFVTAGTASALFWDSTGSRHGFSAFSTSGQELDLSNPVLFRMRVALRTTLSDTAFLRWDSLFPLFNDAAYGIDSVIETDGWVRTANSFGRTSLSMPGAMLQGVYHDSIPFQMFVKISDISHAHVKTAQLSLLFDPHYLYFRGVSGGAEAGISDIHHSRNLARGFDSLVIQLASRSGAPLHGSDILVNLEWSGIAFAGSYCTSVWDVHYEPTNSDALRGNIEIGIDSVCITGSLASVERHSDDADGVLRCYPNPVRSGFSIDAEDLVGDERYRVFLNDDVGRCVLTTESSARSRIEVPSDLRPGVYYVEIDGIQSRERRHGRISIVP